MDTLDTEAPEAQVILNLVLDCDYRDWYSEHNNALGDGFAYIRGVDNRVVGINVDGEEYKW